MIVKAAALTIVIAAAVRRASLLTHFGCCPTNARRATHAQLVGFGVLAGPDVLQRGNIAQRRFRHRAIPQKRTPSVANP